MMMKWMKAYAAARITAANRSDGWLREAAGCTETELLARLDAAPAGLTEEQAEAAREKYGRRSTAPTRWRGPGASARPGGCWKPLPTRSRWYCCCWRRCRPAPTSCLRRRDSGTL